MKKFLSVILSLCMVVSLASGIVIDTTANAAGTDLYYDFIAANTSATEDNAYTATITYDMTTSSPAPWAFHSRSTEVNSGNGYFRYMSNNVGLYLYGGTKQKPADTYYGMLKINVTEAGSYIPQINLHGGVNFAYATPFVASILEYDSATNTVGSVVASKTITFPSYTAPDHYVSISDTPVSLEEKEYVLKIALYDNCMGTTIVDGLKLVAADSPVCTSVKIGNDDGLYTVATGEDTTVALSAIMSDGSTADLSTATFEYSTADVATASIENGALKIVGNKAGTTTLTVRVGAAMARTNIKVVDEPAPATLTYNFTKPVNSGRENLGKDYIKFVKYANMTTGAYGEMNTDKQSAPWEYVSRSIDETNGYLKYNNKGDYGIAMYLPGNFTLKVKVYADGKYLPKVNLHAATSGAVTVKISDLSSNEILTKTIPVDGVTGDKSLADAAIDLKAGEYYVNISQATKSKLAIINSMTLTYVPVNYNVTLNTNGATSCDALASYTSGTAVALPTPVKTGYTFGGWYADANFAGKAVTKISALDTGDKTFYAKWNLDVAKTNFTTTADSGYYAESANAETKTGEIAFNTFFDKYADYSVEKFGIYVYRDGNEAGKADLYSVDEAALTAADGKFYALVTAIEAAYFDTTVIAMPYVVIDGETVFGDAVDTTVNTAKWLGTK